MTNTFFLFSCLLFLTSSNALSEHSMKANDYHHAQNAVIKYSELRQNPVSQNQLRNHVHKVWSARTVNEAGIKNASLAHVQEIQPLTTRFKLTSMQILFEDFAIARLDDWENTHASLLTLFKTDNTWKVATEVYLDDTCTKPQKRYNPDLPYQQILKRLQSYYLSVEADNPEPLDQVHHATWQMKNHEEQQIVAEGNASFKKRLEPNKHTGYADAREVADIQLIYDCAALIRIDKPTSQSVTVFTMLKENNTWFIVEKAFSYNKKR